MWASRREMQACLRCLVLEGGANIHAQDLEGSDMAAMAASRGQAEVLRFLVQEAQVVNVEATGVCNFRFCFTLPL